MGPKTLPRGGRAKGQAGQVHHGKSTRTVGRVAAQSNPLGSGTHWVSGEIPHYVGRFGITTQVADVRNVLGEFSGWIPGTSTFSRRTDVVDRVGQTSSDSRSLFSIHNPMMTSFASLAFRPQLWVKGYPSFEHNPDMSVAMAYADEAVRPQVLVIRSWGAQNASGEWAYTQQPDDSRARGGTGTGGILFSPPQFEMEDYFQINSQADVKTRTTSGCVTVAPGVAFGLGIPLTTGGLATGGVIIEQDATDTVNDPLLISQMRNGAKTAILKAQVIQASGLGQLDITANMETAGNITIQDGFTLYLNTVKDASLKFTGGNIVLDPKNGLVSNLGSIQIPGDQTLFLNGGTGTVHIGHTNNNIVLTTASGLVSVIGGIQIPGDQKLFLNGATGTVSVHNTGNNIVLTTASGLVDVIGALDVAGDVTLRNSDEITLGPTGGARFFYDGVATTLVPDTTSNELLLSGDLKLIDNDKVLFGTGEDAQIYYDGTDLQIKSKVVGTGKTTFDDVVNAVAGFEDNGTAGIDKTLAFVDNILSTHDVIISGGIITQWNVTPV